MDLISFCAGIIVTLLCLYLLSLIAQRRSDRHMDSLHGYWEQKNGHDRERNEVLQGIDRRLAAIQEALEVEI